MNEYAPSNIGHKILLAFIIGGLLSLVVAIARAEGTSDSTFDFETFFTSHELLKNPTPCILDDKQYVCLAVHGDDKADAYIALFDKWTVLEGGIELPKDGLALVYGIFKDAEKEDITVYARKEGACASGSLCA